MGLFGKSKEQLVALIDIGSSSVGGAYAYFEPASPPTLYFTARIPIVRREGEEAGTAMLRALGELGAVMVRYGGPVLRKEKKGGHISCVLTSIASPWQETRVRVETLSEDKPFLFTRQLLHETAKKTAKPVEGRREADEAVIATLLNGYEIGNPFGKKAKRADLIILSSTLNEKVSNEIEKALRHAFHSGRISTLAFAPLAYAVIRDMYPHEKDFLVVDITGEATDFIFVKQGILTDVSSIPQGAHSLIASLKKEHNTCPVDPVSVPTPTLKDSATPKVNQEQEAWKSAVSTVLRDFKTRHALPRTVFLLADEPVRAFTEGLLDSKDIHSLWLSDEPLAVIALCPEHLAEFVRTRGEAEGDVFLALLALYQNKHFVPLPKL